MKQKKANLIISAVALVASLIVVLYLIMNAPQRIEFLIIFSLIALADTYFLVDSIHKKIDEIANASLDKQNEIAKVEKGLYTVAKREELISNERYNKMFTLMEELKSENERLTRELIEQEKLCTKILIKKSQETGRKMITNGERISDLLVQLNDNSTNISAEMLETLSEINQTLENYYDQDEAYYNHDTESNVIHKKAN